jgi:peptide/nickel transport system substrate-binding protein
MIDPNHRSRASRVHLMATVLGLVILLASCAPAPVGRESGPQPTAPSASRVLRIGMQAQSEPARGTDGPPSPAPYGGMRPNSSAGLEHFMTFHGALTKFDTASQGIPHLAEKIPTLQDGDWILLPDGGMEVTWKLRPNVRWHDGQPLTADDFVFGFTVVRDPLVVVAARGELSSITEVRATDARTLVATWRTTSILGNVSLSDGIPAIPRHLFGDLYAAGDPVAFENSSRWNTQWVGLGPYRLTDWVLGNQMEGVAFDDYFLGRPKIDRLIIRYLGDVNALIANLLSGDLDVAPLGAQLDPAQMVVVRQAWGGDEGGTTLAIPKGVRSIYLQLRDPSAPWAQDVRVRQALLHAIDRQEIVDALLFGVGGVPDFFGGPEEPAYRLALQRGVPRYPYDPARAERLLTEAGWTRGPDRLLRNSAGETASIDIVSSAQGSNVQEAETVASHWIAAGFQSRATPFPPTAENSAEIRSKMPGALIWVYNFSPTVIRTFTSDEIPSERTRWRGANYSQYADRTFDSLYGQLINTFDPEPRQEIMFQLFKNLNEQLPALPVFFSPHCLVARKHLQGPGLVSALQPASSWNIHEWQLNDR